MSEFKAVEFSENIGELAKALAAAQGSMSNAKKSSDNPFFKSKYADLAEVWDTCREPLAKNNLAVIQMPGNIDEQGNVEITTMLTHSSGGWIKAVMSIKVSKMDAQGIGSAITYGRRYALAALVGIAQEDDDAESAVGHTKNGNKSASNKSATKPAEGSQLVCSVCGTPIDQDVSDYSLKNFGVELCRVCQAKKKANRL